MFAAKKALKNHSTACKLARRFCEKSKFQYCKPCRRRRYSLACWVSQRPDGKYEILFRSNVLSVDDFEESEKFGVFLADKKLWNDLVTTKPHMNEKRVAIMQGMVERGESLSRNACHPDGNIDGLMSKIFG